MKILILMIGMLLCSTSQAEWYEAKGQATIVNNQIDQARSTAMQEAVKQLLLYSGASVTSISQVNGGRLTLDQLEVVSKGSLHNLTVLDEGQQGQQFYVILQADVTCFEFSIIRFIVPRRACPNFCGSLVNSHTKYGSRL